MIPPQPHIPGESVSHQPNPQQQPGWGPPQQPIWGTPPPRPPKKKANPAVIALAAVGIIGFWVIVGTALGSPDDTSKGSASASSPAKAAPTEADDKPPADNKTPGLSKRELTRLTVSAVWNSYDTTQRDTLCLGIDVYGEDELAEQMQSDNLDPDYAAELISAKCESR